MGPAPQPAALPAPSSPYAYAGGAPGSLERFGNSLGERWLKYANVVVGIYAALPWLAPVFAALGWWPAANVIYTVYALLCHQLPERAGYLFGYQAANCYRDDALYTAVFLAGLLYAAARGGSFGGRLHWMLRPIRWQVFVLLVLPVLADGLSHMLGFRETNAWFDQLTGGALGDFAVGDSLGTLNWWLRMITGSLAGFAAVRFIYPRIQRAFDDSRRLAEERMPLFPPAAPAPQ